MSNQTVRAEVRSFQYAEWGASHIGMEISFGDNPRYWIERCFARQTPSIVEAKSVEDLAHILIYDRHIGSLMEGTENCSPSSWMLQGEDRWTDSGGYSHYTMTRVHLLRDGEDAPASDRRVGDEIIDTRYNKLLSLLKENTWGRESALAVWEEDRMARYPYHL
jgi:hypothetical protein